jgi:hypothetical protein
MKGIITFFLISIILLVSCQKEKPVPVSGEVTMNSTLYGTGPYYVIGFSFSQGRLIEYRDGNVPDITILPKTDVSGNVINAFLDTPNVNPSFSLTAAFDSEDEASSFFADYLEVADNGYVSLADPILPYQIWTFKTGTGNFVKLMIRKLDTRTENQVAIAEVVFRYVYQPDGSTIFPE